MTDKCLVPSCGRTPHARGLCDSCYLVALRCIKECKTTWAKLEKAKKARPKAAGIRRVYPKNWFIGESR